MSMHINMMYFFPSKVTCLCNLFRIHFEFHILLYHQNMVNFVLAPGVITSSIIMDSQNTREIVHRQLITLNPQFMLELSNSSTSGEHL